MYEATPPDLLTEISKSQTRRLAARRTSLTGDTHRLRLSPMSISVQDLPHSGRQSSHVPVTPLQSDYSVDKGKSVSRTPSFQGPQTSASTSFAQVQPLQKCTDIFQPQAAHSHYRPQAYYDQNHRSSSNEGQVEPAPQSSVVLRTSALVPSSPLLKSTVPNSRAADASPIQADPTSPYYTYTFQDARLIPNPIIRIFMANQTNPRMFSLQDISPDTLSLLLSVSPSHVRSGEGLNS
jgi:hypothetical protein